MRPPDPRLTVTEALLAFVAAVAGLISAGSLLYALLGVWALPLVQLLFIAGPVLIACRGRGPFRLAPQLLGVRAIAPVAAIGAVMVGASFWYLQTQLLVPIADRWLGGQETAEEIQQLLLPEGAPVPLVAIMVSLFPGVCEELLFRGAVLRALQPRVGAAAALGLSALLFALFHVYPAQMLPNLAFGLLLGGAVLATGSVVTAMLLHAVHNAVVLLMASGVLDGVAVALVAHPGLTLAGAFLTSAAGLALVLAGGSARKRWPAHGKPTPS